MRAREIHLVAVMAPPNGVVGGKTVPMAFLTGGQKSRPLTQRADIIQSRQHRRPDKPRPVGDILERLQKVRIRFKRNNFRLGVFHVIFPFGHDTHKNITL